MSATRRPAAMVTIGLAVVAGGWIATAATRGRPAAGSSVDVTDFEIDLRGLDEQVVHTSDPAMRADLHFRRASMINDWAALRSVATLIADAERQQGPTPELCLLSAAVALKFHRLADVKVALARSPALAGNTYADALLVDVAFQEGRYAEAAAGYRQVVARRRTWENLARLAHALASAGDSAGADAAYRAAEEEVTAKSMRAFAWLQVQRGQLHFRRGDYATAEACYTRARHAYSGDWLVDEHLAELHAARREFEAAIALYERMIARTGAPEVVQQLGDLYAYMGRPDAAKPWHDRALSGYLDSANRGEVMYLHHLAAYYADVAENGPEAVRWAQRDASLRPNAATEDALAWALHRAGRTADAVAASDRAMAYGQSDAHVLYHAALIRLAAGQTDVGRQLLRRVADINPRYQDFHVHR